MESLKPKIAIIGLKNEVENDMEIFIDKYMFNTVFRNLLENAVKYTNANGEISVIAKKMNGNILFSVIDSGVGILPENIPKLFRLDSQFSTPGTENEKGTGLGLLLCKEFIEKHNGKIWVESKPGYGSEFKFTIPVTM